MKAPFQIVIFGLLCLFLFNACKNDKNSSDGGELVQQKEEVIEQPKVVVPMDLDSSAYAFIPAFVEYVEQTYCMQTYKSAEGCLELYESTVRDDFLEGRRIDAKFPYDGSFDWKGLTELPGYNEYWSDKCGFQSVEKDVVVRYHCPMITSEMLVWLNKIKQGNDLIIRFVDEYTRTQTISSDYQRAMVLGTNSTFDFSNVDHKAFYWTYHLTLAEEFLADRKFSKLLRE